MFEIKVELLKILHMFHKKIYELLLNAAKKIKYTKNIWLENRKQGEKAQKYNNINNKVEKDCKKNNPSFLCIRKGDKKILIKI